MRKLHQNTHWWSCRAAIRAINRTMPVKHSPGTPDIYVSVYLSATGPLIASQDYGRAQHRTPPSVLSFIEVTDRGDSYNDPPSHGAVASSNGSVRCFSDARPLPVGCLPRPSRHIGRQCAFTVRQRALARVSQATAINSCASRPILADGSDECCGIGQVFLRCPLPFVLCVLWEPASSPLCH